MLGSFAALVMAVLPALRNSTVDLLSANIFDRLSKEKSWEDQIRPVTVPLPVTVPVPVQVQGLVHDHWVEHEGGKDDASHNQDTLVPGWITSMSWELDDHDWDVDMLMDEVNRNRRNRRVE